MWWLVGAALVAWAIKKKSQESSWGGTWKLDQDPVTQKYNVYRNGKLVGGPFDSYFEANDFLKAIASGDEGWINPKPPRPIHKGKGKNREYQVWAKGADGYELDYRWRPEEGDAWRIWAVKMYDAKTDAIEGGEQWLLGLDPG